MPRAAPRPPAQLQTALTVWAALGRFPLPYRVGLVALGLLGFALYTLATHGPAPAVAPAASPTTGLNPDGSGTFLFAFWNVENLFDDKDDRRREVDEPFDNAFADDAKMRQLKLDHLADILLKMNGGKGPDILAACEVESPRAADLLKATLNRKLTESGVGQDLQYTQVAMKDLDAGRHIAPCVITRLNVVHQQSRLLGYQLRILETHLNVNGYDLTLVASHWTSQLTQRDGGNGSTTRDKYAGLIRKAYDDASAKKSGADFLVCGDFNTTPESSPVAEQLGTTSDRTQLKPGGGPLLNLLGGKSPANFGTITYSGKPLIYDQICVSPGMLDNLGWSCDPDSVQVVTSGLTRPGASRREPWRFGDPKNPPVGGRGYSDHFPVTVTLKLQPRAAKPPE